jgi:hypothetical protein
MVIQSLRSQGFTIDGSTGVAIPGADGADKDLPSSHGMTLL